MSKQAWLDWQAHQTMLINEKHLSLADPEARKYLQQEMDKFCRGQEYDKAEGYVPRKNSGARPPCGLCSSSFPDRLRTWPGVDQARVGLLTR